MKSVALIRENRGLWWQHWCFCCVVLLALVASYQLSWAGQHRRDLSVGVGVHLWNAPRSEIDKQIEIAAKAGFSMIRWDAPWKVVETSPGHLTVPPTWDYIVDSANRRGIASLLILDYGNPSYDNGDKPLSQDAIEGFVRYSRYLVEHFRGRVHYVEIWNEWDGNTGATTPGSPQSYIRLLTPVYAALKKVDSGLTVIGGASSAVSYSSLLGIHIGYDSEREGFFEKLLRLGLAGHVDGISVHPYVYYLTGCMGTDAGFYTSLLRIEGAVRRAKLGRQIPIFVTEIGWPVGVWKSGAIDDHSQAEYLARTIQIADSMPHISTLILYQLKDAKVDPADKEANFGLVGAKGRLKASYGSTADVVSKIGHDSLLRIERTGCPQ